MAVLTEGRHTGEFILSEANRMRSRDNAVLAKGQILDVGAILSRQANGPYTSLDPEAEDGTQTAIAVLYAATDASDAAAECVVFARECELKGGALVWPEGISDEDKLAAIASLADKNIIIR
jgi:hypothetical protein